MIQSVELGRIPGGYGVCIGKDSLEGVVSHLGMSEEEFLDAVGAVEFGWSTAVNLGVDEVTAVDVDGRTYRVVVIGCEPEKFLRFLNKDEPTFEEYFKAHPRYVEVGTGKDFNRAVLGEISQEYRKRLLGR